MKQSTRAWLHRIAVAVISLLVVYGFMGEAEAAEWTILAGAILGVAEGVFASVYTPVKDRKSDSS